MLYSSYNPKTEKLLLIVECIYVVSLSFVAQEFFYLVALKLFIVEFIYVVYVYLRFNNLHTTCALV